MEGKTYAEQTAEIRRQFLLQKPSHEDLGIFNAMQERHNRMLEQQEKFHAANGGDVVQSEAIHQAIKFMIAQQLVVLKDAEETRQSRQDIEEQVCHDANVLTAEGKAFPCF